MSPRELTKACVGVAVVTFNPDAGIESRLRGMAAQGRMLVVVDNASRLELRAALEAACVLHGWEWVPNERNLGIGAALNQGVLVLREHGCEWALLFDQDSAPAAGLTDHLLHTVEHHPEPDRVAVVGASFWEAATGRRHRVLRRHPWLPGWFQKVAPEAVDMPDVTMVITSGSMVRVADFVTLGEFDEGFFIDYVDTDFCLRCIEKGRRVAVSATARFEHEFGQREFRSWCGMQLQPTNHSALRHYYIARNRVPMWRRHAWRQPHWALFDLAAAGLWLGRLLAVEDNKRRKVYAMAVGTWDGLRGRTGACPGRLQAALMNEAGAAGQDHRRSQ